MIVFGKRYYASLRKKYPGHVILYTPTASIGDLCYIKKILPTILRLNHISKPYLLLAEKSVYDTAKTLNFELCIPVSKTELFPLAMMHTLYGDELEDLFNCLAWELFYPKYVKADITYEHLYEKSDKSSSFCLKPGRNIILAPFENTATQLCEDTLSRSFWERLSKYLLDLNYTVYTNCRKNSEEQPISGTIKLELPLKSLQEAVANSDAVIAMRSGLADFLCDIPVPQYILYPDDKWLEKYSLKRISENRQLAEIVYRPYLKAEDKLIVYLLDQIGREQETDVDQYEQAIRSDMGSKRMA